jgi:hypothetical protein
LQQQAQDHGDNANDHHGAPISAHAPALILNPILYATGSLFIARGAEPRDMVLGRYEWIEHPAPSSQEVAQLLIPAE